MAELKRTLQQRAVDDATQRRELGEARAKLLHAVAALAARKRGGYLRRGGSGDRPTEGSSDASAALARFCCHIIEFVICIAILHAHLP